MSGLQPGLKGKKKKRVHEEHLHHKRPKLESLLHSSSSPPSSSPHASSTSSNKAIQFETTLSLPIQQALHKFREASEQELIRLKKEGMDPSTAINQLVEKMRTTEDDSTHPGFTRQELELVMEIAGVNEEGATRALILRSELAKLRHDGFNHPEAINELSRRMKRLAGSKRRGSISSERRASSEGKHRRKDTLSTPITSTSLSFSTTPISSTSTPRVNFTTYSLESLSRHPLLPPLSRKRIPDALMMDDEQFEQLRKRHRYEKEDSDSEDSGSEAYCDEFGEFSHDDEEDNRKEKEGKEEEEDNIHSSHHGIPSLSLHAFSDYPPSSDEDELYKDDGMVDLGADITSWHPSMLFPPIKEEEEGDEEESETADSWLAPRISTPSTTTTTTTTTTTSTNSTSPFLELFPPLSPSLSPPLSPPLSPSPSPPPRATHIGSKTTKRRDSPSPKVFSHRTIS